MRPGNESNKHCYIRQKRMSHIPVADELLEDVLAHTNDTVNSWQKAKDKDKIDETRLQIVTSGKAFFPYEFCDNFDKLYKTKKLPTKDHFYSGLHETNISESDYTCAEAAWNAFHCENLLEYTLVYNIIDVLLLAELFEQYRRSMFAFVGLDPSQFITGPSFSYQAMLKMTDVKLEQLTDKKMVDIVCENLRGGLSFVSSRYESANEQPDKFGERKRILYLDANNLYGAAQSMKLPVDNFVWLSKEEIESRNWQEMSTTWTGEEEIGYFILCDLTYPSNLHFKHEQFPLAVEKRQITGNDLSKDSIATLIMSEGRTSFKESKLTTTFYPRERYLTHYMCLKTYLRKGLELKKIREVISFRQSYFMRDFIQKCTKMRQKSTTKLESAFYKRLVNSIYGNHLQNKHGRLKMHVCRSGDDLAKYASFPQFQSAKWINDDLVFSFSKEPFVLLDRAYSVGFTVLELSKDIVGKFFYDVLYPNFDNIHVVTSDTDSILFSYKSKTLTQNDDLQKIAAHMDFSNYSKDHPLFDKSHKNEIFYWKNELSSDYVISKVCALRSKCYCFQSVAVDKTPAPAHHEKVVCKGIPKTGRKRLTLDDYVNCIKEKKKIMASFQSIRHKNFTLTTMDLRKVALSSFDCKRFVLSCSIHSRPFGSAGNKKIGNMCFICEKKRIKEKKKSR